MNIQFKPSRFVKFNMHGSFGYGLINWWLTLYRNSFKIDFLMLPKLLWITTSILSTMVFRVLERILYNRKIKNTKVAAPVFIIGYSRSGTTYLHYLLSKDTQFSYPATYQVLMPHLFLTMGAFLKRFIQFMLPPKRLMDNLKMGAELPKEEEFAVAALSDASIVNGYYFPQNIMRYFKRYVLFSEGNTYENEWKKNFLFFLQKLSFQNPAKTLLVKSPLNTGRIKQILDIFPDAKFIHIHRNPYEVYYSNEKLYESILPALAFHKVSNEDMETFILESYKLMYHKYLNEKHLIKPGNITTVAYEDFVKNPLESIEKVYADLSLQGFSSTISSFEKELMEYKNYEKNKHVMNDAVKEKILAYWKDFFEVFGYNKPTYQILSLSPNASLQEV